MRLIKFTDLLKKYSKTSATGIFLLFFLHGCTVPKPVAFPSPVDTKSKAVSYPEKQVFSIPELGVYASNDFDGARLNDFEKINDSTVNLVIRPENSPINKSPYYAFTTWADTLRTIYFTFDYPSGYKHRYTPKLKTKNGNWAAADSTNIFLKDSQVIFKTRLSRDTLLIAAQEIFTSTDVKMWYSGLAKKYNSIHIRSAGQSVLGKNLPLLDIYSGEAKGKDIIVLLTRQHPPEVTGYMAFQSFLETLLEPSLLSEKFLQRYRILAFPIMNPDGVDMGHWRHNAGGIDLNRDWSRYRQPEVKNVAKIIETAAKKDKGRVILGLDFHSTYHDVFYTSPQRENTTLPGFIPEWFSVLEARLPDYKVNEDSSVSTRPVSQGWFLKRFKAVGITYEIGDATPRDFIQLKGKVSATAMMEILLNMSN